ncbi:MULTISPECIES: ANTAR domain-containing response regulator [Auritidibacter]|uniref:Response regulator n=1 Tax=Auritidibacter ignavus TaxID=678932 RepID=A0AAJ6DCZ1_9MICC|nr:MULTISPECIES: response regulator [Auritidibacter]PXA82405.1 response regulator [Auritidibacter sp. NML120779]AXR73468.1 response regulator [Auritidibacter sp. NML130574]NIH70725.1 response regulator NasT [Auritidibacter ignavus]PXA77733.1 response regulator [Auritidibacter sp. NML100628]PXA80369.1 response regulator [Auritidibacter sp. NML120636]
MTSEQDTGQLGLPRQTRRIVVAEDETIIRLDIVETLEGLGYEVVGQAENGQRAIDLTRQHQPDVVLMDISMPVVDGIVATREICAEKLAPVVILTALPQRELIIQATEAGAMAYLVKPFKEQDLVPAIELAAARFDQMQALANEVSDITERFETRKMVDRAKTWLMETLGLTEPEAFRWIQKTSMDRRLTMHQVAATVVEQMNSSRGVQDPKD